MCQELGKIDERIYTDNPIVDSVLRIKFGLAKSEGIEIDTAIHISRQVQLERGDISVLIIPLKPVERSRRGNGLFGWKINISPVSCFW